MCEMDFTAIGPDVRECLENNVSELVGREILRIVISPIDEQQSCNRFGLLYWL